MRHPRILGRTQVRQGRTEMLNTEAHTRGDRAKGSGIDRWSLRCETNACLLKRNVEQPGSDEAEQKTKPKNTLVCSHKALPEDESCARKQATTRPLPTLPGQAAPKWGKPRLHPQGREHELKNQANTSDRNRLERTTAQVNPISRSSTTRMRHKAQTLINAAHPHVNNIASIFAWPGAEAQAHTIREFEKYVLGAATTPKRLS